VFTSEQQQDLSAKHKHLISLYKEVKPYVIASEKAAGRLGAGLGPKDPRDVSLGDRLSIVAINELRNAFDHEMRAQAVWQGCSEVPKESGLSAFDYCMTNLRTACGSRVPGRL